MEVIEETKCRVCEGKLEPVLDFDSIYPSSFVSIDADLSTYEKAPLVIARCSDCGLFQLKHTVNLDSMYKQYWYRSGLNRSMLSDLKGIVTYIESKIELNDGDVVVDIGCNDGSMFDFYSKNVNKVGFDPAINLNTKDKCDVFINDYFDATKYPCKDKAKVVTSIAMFYDLPNPNKFIEDVKEIMADDGIWIVQFTDLYSMLTLTAFDNICHEHLEYYDLIYLNKLFYRHGLIITDIDYNKVNGGSVRLLLTKEGSNFKINNNIFYYIDREYKLLSNPEFIAEFYNNIIEQGCMLMEELYKMKSAKLSIYGIGASTKGNTLLQIWNIGTNLLSGIYEINRDKFGLKTLGSDIPIVEEDIKSVPPSALLLLPWHFIDNILETYHDYLVNGGIIITPLPIFKMYYWREDRLWTLTKKPLDS
jgi:hypothetical protein